MVVDVGTAVASAMAVDGWERARQAVVGLWRSCRPREADRAADELTVLRGEVLGARRRADRADEERLAAQWQLRLTGLVAGAPDGPALLERLRAEVLAAASAPPPRADQRASAGDNSVIVQIGGSAGSVGVPRRRR
jgi:hypothetical protein